MARFLKFCAGILIAFVLVNLLYLFLLPRIDWDFGKTREAHQFKNQQLKLLVFGNSTAMDGINTEILSKHFGPSYNFSVGGASLQTNYIQLKNYLQQNSAPEKVLLVLSSAHINYFKANDVNPIIAYYYGNSFPVKKLEDIPLFKFRWLFVENIKKLLSSNHRSAQIVHGQLRIKSIVPDNTLKKTVADSCHNNQYYNSSGYEYMWQIAALCREKNIQLEIFEMPCWKDVQNNCQDITVNRMMGNSNYDLYIHNLNNYHNCDTLLDSKKDWLSKNHLNYYGSLKITDEVVRVLLR